jgi:uncharacterized protein YndB with AHSA1/START domain
VARIEVSTHVEQPPERVWALLTDWESQPRWMIDARSVTVLSRQREGGGTLVRCRTDLLGRGGPVVTDDMVVTDWDPSRTLAIRHLGRLIRGVGAFELEPTAHGTRVTWWEEIDPPFGGLGETAASLVVVPAVRRVFRASLAGLKRLAESRSVRP